MDYYLSPVLDGFSSGGVVFLHLKASMLRLNSLAGLNPGSDSLARCIVAFTHDLPVETDPPPYELHSPG